MSLFEGLKKAEQELSSSPSIISTLIGIIFFVLTYALLQSLILSIAAFIVSIIPASYYLYQQHDGCVFCGATLTATGQYCVKCGRPQN